MFGLGTWLSSVFTKFMTLVGVFLSGVMTEKYNDASTDLKTEKARDLEDAKPRPNRADILMRMRSRKRD